MKENINELFKTWHGWDLDDQLGQELFEELSKGMDETVQTELSNDEIFELLIDGHESRI